MFKPFFSLLKKYKPYWLTFPSSCLLCLASLKKGQMAICEGCKSDLPVISQGCERCNLPIPYQGICGQCLQNPPLYHQAIAPYSYDFPIAQLIAKFKYKKQWLLGHLLASLLAEQLQAQYEQGLPKPDFLLCVPLSKQRLRERSFNQAEMLAKWLSNTLNIPLQKDLLTRIINTPPQQQLSAKKRKQNLKNAFKINLNLSIKNLHFAIIDDVLTTGATANTLADILYNQGAKQVDIYTIARTPHSIKK